MNTSGNLCQSRHFAWLSAASTSASRELAPIWTPTLHRAHGASTSTPLLGLVVYKTLKENDEKKKNCGALRSVYSIVPLEVTSLGREGVDVRGCYTPQPGRTLVNSPSGLCDGTMECLRRNNARNRSQTRLLFWGFGSICTFDDSVTRRNIRRCIKRRTKGHVWRNEYAEWEWW